VKLELSEDETDTLRHAAAVLDVLLTQAQRGWSHPALDPTWCQTAAQRLLRLAEGERQTEADHLTIYRVAATIAGCEPFGLDLTIRELLALATRLLPLPVTARLGVRSRPSPLGDE